MKHLPSIWWIQIFQMIARVPWSEFCPVFDEYKVVPVDLAGPQNPNLKTDESTKLALLVLLTYF